MTKNEIIIYRKSSSDSDFKAMEHLYQSGDYNWALFIGHLVIEKLLKAYYIRVVGKNVPFTHNLVSIAKKANLNITEDQIDLLSDLTTFNISVRYEDYKQGFKKRCTKKYAEIYISKIKEFREWIKTKI